MMNKWIIRLLLCILIIVGIYLLVEGTAEIKERNELKKIYKKTTGDYVGKDSDGRERDPEEIDYFVYEYSVDGKTYKIKTDYGSDVAQPSTRTIYYNPDNPAESILDGMSGASTMFNFGIAFTLAPLVMIFLSFDSIYRRVKNMGARSPVRIFDIIQGIVLIILGIVFVYSVTTGFEYPLALFSTGIFIVFPFIFILAGVFLITHCKKSEEEMVRDLEILENKDK